MKTVRNRVIALAGVFQAASQVSAIAHTGQFDREAADASLQSLFTIDTKTVEEAYPSLASLTPGLELVRTQLNRPQDPEITRYVICLLHHARVLMKRASLASRVGDGLRKTEDRLQHFPLNHPNIVAGLADTYAETISTISPRIMVKGDPRFLSRQEIANQVRALLLAGLRSAVLWQQCGGNRLALLFGRQGLIDAAAQLLSELPQTVES